MLDCQFHPVSQKSTFSFYRHVFHSFCYNILYCRSISGTWERWIAYQSQRNQAAMQTAWCPLCLLCMFSLLFWRIVHWILVKQIRYPRRFMFFFFCHFKLHCHSRIFHEDGWYCTYLKHWLFFSLALKYLHVLCIICVLFHSMICNVVSFNHLSLFLRYLIK